MNALLLAVALGVAGLIVGSFLGLISLRLPAGENFVAGRSRCDGCQRRLTWLDLVPVASYVASRGRCRTCGSAIPVRYPVLELAACGLGVWAGLDATSIVGGVLSALFGWQLLLIAAVDLEHLWLPDRLTLPLLATGLVAAALIEPHTIMGAILGAAIGFASMWSFGFIYRRLRGRDGLGGGDPFLFAAGGAWVGWQALPISLLIASLVGISLILARQSSGGAVTADYRASFGPPLAVGFWIAWILQ